MYADRLIVLLNSRSKDAFILPAAQWAKEQRGKVVCHECYKLKRSEVYPLPIDVLLHQVPKGTSHGGVFRGGLGVIHERLLEWLRPYLSDYVLGRCFSRDGSPMRDFHSIYLRDAIRRRGDRTAQYSGCTTCGIVSCSSDEPYVLRRELPDGDVFSDEISWLYLSEPLARRFPWQEFGDREPCIVPVRDELLPDDPFPA